MQFCFAQYIGGLGFVSVMGSRFVFRMCSTVEWCFGQLCIDDYSTVKLSIFSAFQITIAINFSNIRGPQNTINKLCSTDAYCPMHTRFVS